MHCRSNACMKITFFETQLLRSVLCLFLLFTPLLGSTMLYLFLKVCAPYGPYITSRHPAT